MELLTQIDSNLFSLILCGLMLYDTLKGIERKNIQNRLFSALLVTNILLLALEIITWIIDGSPQGPAIVLSPIITILAFILNPLPAFLWTLYVHSQVVQDEDRLRKLLIPYSIPIFLFAILTVLSLATHSLFYFDEANYYHRGPWFFLLAVIDAFYFVHPYFLLLRLKKKIKQQYFYPLMLFPLPVIIGGIIQGMFFGLTLMWSSMTLSLVFVHYNIQNAKLTTDFLTGVNNRLGFQQYFNNILHNAHTAPFGGIILDIDNFKHINDCFGHKAGDQALQITAELLRTSLRKEDFVARYGGDEFVILVNTKYRSTLELIANRITNRVKAYNLTSNQPYTLELSIGYDIFDESRMDQDTFIKHIDALMYKNKRAKVPVQSVNQNYFIPIISETKPSPEVQ